MGEFSLSGNTNIGLSAVEISVNTSKSNPSTIFYTTPTSTESALLPRTAAVASMNDELEKSGANSEEQLPADKAKECETTADLSEKLNEQVVQNVKASSGLQLFHPSEPSTPSSGALWSTAIEDGYVPNLPGVNGGLGFQNFPSSNQSQQLFNQNQGRRAITASHNFPHNIGRQQPSHHVYKGYSSWANPGQSWSGNSSVWNRGRSVPNLTPLQQMGVAGRKPSPTFNHQQQVLSPIKFRRSTSYPGKGPFPQPPTFEITNMDEARDLLPYQVMCGLLQALAPPYNHAKCLCYCFCFITYSYTYIFVIYVFVFNKMLTVWVVFCFIFLHSFCSCPANRHAFLPTHLLRCFEFHVFHYKLCSFNCLKYQFVTKANACSTKGQAGFCNQKSLQ